MSRFVDRLTAIQTRQNSIICVGLDFDRKKVPLHIAELYGIRADVGIEMFNRRIIDAVAPYCSVFKPNLAFYESSGKKGWGALARTVAYIRERHPDHLVIGDGKRNDIGNTAEHYAEGLAQLGFHAVTWNPYMGNETAHPFFKAGLAVIALCLTSNPGAADYQLLECDGKPLYMHVAEKTVADFGASGHFGLVVGATKPEQLGRVRDAIGLDIPILIPGLKTQGGDAAATMQHNKGGQAIINFSRNVLYASAGPDFDQAAEREAQNSNDEVNALRNAV
ncbi:MAG: orotidine-5'-phosphate decarboxylase [Candidatus Kerfeldbacteria bacterium]|nr:orotidine-5'-phosphate decarboxylase [Candidatus Kerfeldbacteria bacterium]